MNLPAAFSFFKSRFVNVGVGTGNSVYVPNHTLPDYSQLGRSGRLGQVIGQLRILGPAEIVYPLAVSLAPVTGAGKFAGSVDYTPLQQNPLIPTGVTQVPPAPNTALPGVTPTF